MVAVKAAQSARFLTSPPASCDAYLFFGTDPGLVTERAQMLAKLLAGRDDPAGDVFRMSDNDLDEDSNRLAVELQTRPMFAGRTIVRATASRRISAPLLKPILEAVPLEGVLIIEAGNLKPDDALRKLFEKHASAAAIACYPDTAGDLERLISEVLASHDMSITPDARAALIDRLGADRALSRAEIEKLALYAMQRKNITEDDIDAIVGDAADLTLERIAEAAASGNAGTAVTDLGRALASGDDAQVIILISQRYFLKLARVRADIDQGARLDEALRGLRPPLHFKQRDVFSTQVRLWSGPALSQALARISETAVAARRSTRLAPAHAERLMLALAAMARQQSAPGVRNASRG